MFYFAWLTERAPFEPEQHLKQDLDILSLQMDHREGCVPVLRLEVPAGEAGDVFQGTPHWGMLSFKAISDASPTPLFCGLLTRVPELTPTHTCFLEFYALPEDLEGAIGALQTTMMCAPHWDPLFASEGSQKKALFEGRAALPHWDRLSGHLTVSDLLEGQTALDIETIFDKTLSFERTRMPLQSITLVASCEWIQSAEGYTDISSEILSKTESGLLETFTPKALARHWWRSGEVFSGSTYRIAHSELALTREEVVPSPAGDLTRAAFTPTLHIAWSLRQKRREVLRLTVSTAPEKGAPGGHSETLNFHLQDLLADASTPPWKAHQDYLQGARVKAGAGCYQCVRDHRARRTIGQDRACWVLLPEDQSALGSPTRASFFTTPRGQAAAQHLLERAKAYVLMSMRTLRIVFEMPFEEALPLSCDTTVRLRHPWSGAVISGKVSAYRLIVQGDGRRYARVEVLSSLAGTEEIRQIQMPDLSAHHPSEGILVPEGITAQDLVEDLEITNDASTQAQWTGEASAKESLMQNPTRVSFFLAPLATKRCLEHTISVHLAPNPSA